MQVGRNSLDCVHKLQLLETKLSRGGFESTSACLLAERVIAGSD